jgi:hypothetical protein
MLRRLLLISVLALVLAPVAAARTHGFTPKTLAGTWSGTWNNQTFNTNGTLKLTIGGTTTMTFTAAITGNTFGCTPPAPTTFKLPKGKGANSWDARGFRISATSAGFGALTASYDAASGKLTANGSKITCAPGLTFSVAGTVSGNTLNATATIHLANGSPATTVVTLTRG